MWKISLNVHGEQSVGDRKLEEKAKEFSFEALPKLESPRPMGGSIPP